MDSPRDPWYQPSFSVDYCHTKAQPRLGHALSACTAKEEVSTWYQQAFKRQVIAVSSLGTILQRPSCNSLKWDTASTPPQCTAECSARWIMLRQEKGQDLSEKLLLYDSDSQVQQAEEKKYQEHWEKAAGGCCTIICCIYHQTHINIANSPCLCFYSLNQDD